MKKVGDWDAAAKMISSLEFYCVVARNISLRRFGLKAEGIAKQHISSQDLGWEELKPRTVAKKIRGGLSEKTLVATSSYFQAITSWVQTTHGTVCIGVRRDTIGKDGQEVHEVARIHEFGSQAQGIPARPLWTPTLQEAVAWHQQVNTPEMILKKKLKQQYGV
jgi:hypothetical protein